MKNYQDYENWKQWVPSHFGCCTALDAAYYSAEIKRTAIELTKDTLFYEIGYGNGSFAGYVQSMGYQYVGSEINQTLIDRGRQFGLQVYEHGIKQVINSTDPGTFDAIFAFDVLEHLVIEDIKIFLQDAQVLLKAGGTLLARIPSGDSPFGRANFHGDITHRTALGSSAVRQLAEQTGFDVMDIGPPSLPIFGNGYVRALRRLGICFAQSVVAKLINLVFHDGQPRVITANLVFVLKKPVKIAFEV